MTVKKVKHLFEHWNSKCDLWHSYDADRLKRTSCLQLKDIQQCWAIPKMHLVLRGGSSIFFSQNFHLVQYLAEEKGRGVGVKKQNKNSTHHPHPPRWSCPAAQLLWGSVPATSSLCPVPWWWWCHHHPCRTVRTPPWTLHKRFIPCLSKSAPFSSWAVCKIITTIYKKKQKRNKKKTPVSCCTAATVLFENFQWENEDSLNSSCNKLLKSLAPDSAVAS